MLRTDQRPPVDPSMSHPASTVEYGGERHHVRNLTNIKVEQAVLHVVAPRRGTLTSSDGELALADVDELLLGHVAKGIADSQAQAAEFNVTGTGSTADLSRRIVKSGSTFIADTKALAANLYNAADPRTSDGTLCVLRCTADGGNKFAALLKLDLANGYFPTTKKDKEGRQVIGIRVAKDALPTERERVQKSAFVRGAGAEFDMLVIDRQRKGDTVSAFFLSGFLGAKPVHDARSRTELLYKALQTGLQTVAKEVEPEEFLALEQYFDGHVVGQRVNVDELIDGMPIAEEPKERLGTLIGAALPDREFELDREQAQKYVRRRVYKGDNDLRLTVPAEYFDEMVTPDYDHQADEWVITIRTKTWSPSR